MPDVSLWVAAIAGGGAVLGAAVSPVSTAYQTARQAVQDRAERRETAVRQACMNLLSSARDLRVQVANIAVYHGSEMGLRLEGLRQLNADVASHADEVALLVPASIADSAAMLAAAVSQVTAAAQANIRSALAASIHEPDFAEIDARIADFSHKAVSYIRAGG